MSGWIAGWGGWGGGGIWWWRRTWRRAGGVFGRRGGRGGGRGDGSVRWGGRRGDRFRIWLRWRGPGDLGGARYVERCNVAFDMINQARFLDESWLSKATWQYGFNAF